MHVRFDPTGAFVPVSRSVCSVDEGAPPAAAGASPPPAPAAPTAATSTAPTAPAPGEEFKAMTPEQFAARLAKERGLGVAEWIKGAGFSKAEEAAATLKAARDQAEAQKTELQKLTERAASLEPRAKAADTYEAELKKYAEQEFKALPDEAQKFVTAQAGDDALARLRAITGMRESGILAKLTAPAAPADPAKPAAANTRAGGTPPAPAPPTGQKHPRDMTPAEFKQFEREQLAKRAGGGA